MDSINSEQLHPFKSSILTSQIFHILSSLPTLPRSHSNPRPLFRPFAFTWLDDCHRSSTPIPSRTALASNSEPRLYQAALVYHFRQSSTISRCQGTLLDMHLAFTNTYKSFRCYLPSEQHDGQHCSAERFRFSNSAPNE